MKLRKPLPPNRSLEQVKNHYLVEKAIAERLKGASREERKIIYATMYDELFRQVPDHPRLTRRADEKRTRRTNETKLALVGEFLSPGGVFVEFAPGDCAFALEVAKFVKTVYAVDISDQRDDRSGPPADFTLILYDGYNLEGIADGSVDVIFSDQLIEHLHPEDTRLHFQLAYRLLKPGGKYVFRTPHALTGPHDVSRYFSDAPQGFHLKEWTFLECGRLLREVNFSQLYAFRLAGGGKRRLPFLYFVGCEKTLELLPRPYRHALARHLVPSVCIAAIK